MALAVKQKMRRTLANPRSAHALASKVVRDRIAHTRLRHRRAHVPHRAQARLGEARVSDGRNHETLAPRHSTPDRSLGGLRHQGAPVVAVPDRGSSSRSCTWTTTSRSCSGRAPGDLRPGQYPQAIAVALILRHSWRPDDLACMLKRLKLRVGDA